MNGKVLLSVVAGILLFGSALYVFDKNIDTIEIPVTADMEDTSDAPSESLPGFILPKELSGFSLKIFAKDLTGARAIAMDPKGRLVVSQTSEGKITALIDANFDHVSEDTKVLASGLNNPHGIAFDCRPNCFLYVAESGELSRYPYNADALSLGAQEKLIDIEASASGHFTRSLLFLPSPNEDTLLISVGSSCNVCEEKDADRASIISYNIKTKQKEQYAKGLRNAVFMALDPLKGKVFATEMGRDNLGDDIPPDEINIIEKGKNYGWPYCYGKNIRDTKFSNDKRLRCTEGVGDTASFIDLQAHSAPLGLAFIGEEGWPEDMWYDILVAYHGSWNRSVPTGYKIVRMKMNARGEYQGTEDFITGWLTEDGKKIGRPVDIKVLSGGTAYITDDLSGVIYRLSRN